MTPYYISIARVEQETGACPEACDLLRDLFPPGNIPLTRESAETIAEFLDFGVLEEDDLPVQWAAIRLLNGEGYIQWLEAIRADVENFLTLSRLDSIQELRKEYRLCEWLHLMFLIKNGYCKRPELVEVQDDVPSNGGETC